MKKSFNCLFVVMFFVFVVNCGDMKPQTTTISLKPQLKYQTMGGWEATAQSGETFSSGFGLYKDELFELAVSDLGINRLRLEITAGVENPTDYYARWKSGQITEKDYNSKRHEVINDNDDPFILNSNGIHFTQLDSTIEKVVLPIKRLLKNRGESLYLNLNFVDFSSGRGSSNMRHSKNPEEYAELMLTTYLHMQQKYGLVPDAVEVILEPDTETGWTATDIGKAIVATAARLEAANFKPAFIAPSTTNAANAPVYIDEIAKVPGAMKHISEFSYHRYCCASTAVLKRISDRAQKYGKQTSMLEWIGADYATLHEDLKLGRNSSWQQYTLAFPTSDNGAQYFLIDDKVPGKPVVTMASRTRFLRQYFRYIRSGAQMIGAESSNPVFDPLAFIDSNGKYVVVVKSDAPGTITIEGLPQNTYGISYTTAKESKLDAAKKSLKKGESLKATIPSAGVITVFAEKVDGR